MDDAENSVGPFAPDLELVLLANGLEVAKSNDSRIWISAMASITGQSSSGSAVEVGANRIDDLEDGQLAGGPLAAFADDLGLEISFLEAAADPTEVSPFISLDHKYWEALKNTAGRGRTPPVVLAGTLLLLWGRHVEIGTVTTSLCAKVLGPIGLTTKNAARGFKNCEWIQFREGALKLNPAKISQAEELAKAYCLGRD